MANGDDQHPHQEGDDDQQTSPNSVASTPAEAATDTSGVEPDPTPSPDTVADSEAESSPAPADPAAASPDPAPADPVVEVAPRAGPERSSAPTASTPAPPKGAPPRAGVPAPGERPPSARPTGKVVEGVVTAVSSDEVELTLDDGRQAVISRSNFGPNNEDPTTVLSPNDRAFGAELVREDPKRRVVLSRVWALKKLAWDKIAAKAENKETISGKVVSAGAKGVVVDVGVRGFAPSSHLELEVPTDLSPYVDQTMEFRVLEVDPKRERLVLSRRSLLLKEQRKKAQSLLADLKPGSTCRGTVNSITDYGAFVDLGGVNGLIHLSELSWDRVRKVSDVVSLGDELEVYVLDVKAKKRRVSLSLRQLVPDPLSELTIGAIHTGPVTRLVDFGAFVSLGGDVEGLVHLSELAEFRVSTPEEVVTPGDEVAVKVLSVDRKRRRVELSIRRAVEYEG